MRTVIITGANSGLGFETARKVALNKNYRIILACRNSDKALQAVSQIKEQTGNQNIEYIKLDTASLSSVRDFVTNYKKSNYGEVYALLCNAGISGTHTGRTDDGYDVVFETNHLGHFLLANLMLPYMDSHGKIFVTSSDMHDAPMKEMKWEGTESLAHPDETLASDSIRYSYSKLCNLYFVYEMARRLSANESKIRINAFNPGLMQTNFMSLPKDAVEHVKQMMPERVGDIETSSEALAELVTNDDLAIESAQYFDRSIHTCPSSKLSYDEKNANELWTASEKYVAI